MGNEFSIVVIGQLTLDDIVRFGDKQLPDCPGGAALYAIGGAYMWRQGKIGFVTRKGCDFDLAVINDACAGFVDTAGVIEMPTPGIHIWSMFDRCGNRYFINQRWSGQDSNMSPLPEDIPARFIGSTDSYLIMAFPLKWQAEIIKVMPEGATVMVDPHFDGIYTENRAVWDELLKKVTHFMPSEDELIRFFGIGVMADLRDYVPYLAKIAELGPEVVCAKLGARGALAYEKASGACWHVPPCKAEIVDVTGCGDTFCGGFLASYVKDHDVYEALLHGTVSSSLNIERLGSMSNFSIEQSAGEKRLSDFRSGFTRDNRRIN